MQINADALVSLQIFLHERHASVYSDAVKEGLSIYGESTGFPEILPLMAVQESSIRHVLPQERVFFDSGSCAQVHLWMLSGSVIILSSA